MGRGRGSGSLNLLAALAEALTSAMPGKLHLSNDN